MRILLIGIFTVLFLSCGPTKTKEEKMIEELKKDSIVNEEIDNLIKDYEESFETLNN